MVATEKEKVFGIFDFVSEKKTDCFQGLFAAVHVIAQEEVVGLGWEAPVLEQTEQVVVLAMDIT